MIGISNYETNFPQKLLLTDTQVLRIRKAFPNRSAPNIKFSKYQYFKMVQSGGLLMLDFIADLFPPFKIINSVATSYVKELNDTDTKKLNSNVLIHTRLNMIGKKIKKGISSVTGSGITLANNEIKDVMKALKPLQNRGILLKGTSRKITSHEGGFLNVLKPLMTAGLPLM